MIWSKHAPFEPGWYWRREGSDDHGEIVHVWSDDGHLRFQDSGWPEEPDLYVSSDNPETEWAGPIERPTNG